MKEKNAYSEKLRDPRWQKRRLEILQRDEFTCKRCGDDKTMLSVHHFGYRGDPWEAPDEWLITVCENCHSQEHEYRAQTEKDFIQSFYKAGFFSTDLIEIADALKDYHRGLLPHVSEVVASAIAWHISDKKKFKKMVEDYFKHLENKKI